MDQVRALFQPFNLRRAIMLALFVTIVVVFRHLAVLFVFFVAFERSLGYLTRLLARRAGIRQGLALAAVLALLATTIAVFLGLGAGRAVSAFFAFREALPERIAAFRETALFARIQEHVNAEALIQAAKDNAARALGYLATFGHFVLHAFVGFILAVVFLMEQEDVDAFRASLDPRSLPGTLVRWFSYTADAISVTLQFQLVVAACNAVLTLPVLLLVGIPHAAAFMFMIFVSGMVPVVGNFLSGAVLTLLAYQARGWAGVALFTGLTFVLHKLESYYLNPRLAARHVRMPGFILVVSLVLWEHLLGFAGLFISFPFLYLALRIRSEFQEEDAVIEKTSGVRIFPFHALRPPAQRAAAVASVPYDVVNTEEARALAAGNALSFLHVVRPEIDLAPDTDIHADAVYAQGRANLERAIREAPLLEDPEPGLYVYRLRMDGRNQTGVVACCAIDDYDEDRIRKHERTRKDKEDDRTRHVVETRCQAEPIFLAYRGREEIDRLVADATAGAPLYDFTAPDGIGHTVWHVSQPEPLVKAFSQVPLLYVADGHHRSASASRARAHFRAGNPGHTGQEEYNRVLATVFPSDQLRILPYNRVVRDLQGRTPAEFLQALGERFPVTPGLPPSPDRRGDFRVCVREGDGLRWYGFRIEAPANAGVLESLDVSLLQDHVLAPLLGIDDPRTSTRVDFVGGIRGTRELERLAQEGTAAAAFTLHPTSLEELMAVADAGEIMPPKSTWFEPKLRSGLFLHRI